MVKTDISLKPNFILVLIARAIFFFFLPFYKKIEKIYMGYFVFASYFRDTTSRRGVEKKSLLRPFSKMPLAISCLI